MLDRRLLLFFSLSAVLLPAVAAGAPPRQNLLAELRWVESGGVSGAALAGVREGAVVVGTAGSASPRPGLSLSTRRQETEDGQIQRIVVLNGHQASIMLSETHMLQWLDYGVELGGHGRARIQAQSRAVPVERQRGFVLTPHWPGGRQPVRVELRTLSSGSAGAGAQAELLSTVQLALGDWLTVARSGGAAARPPQPGVISSSDAEGQHGRELQLRISLAP